MKKRFCFKPGLVSLLPFIYLPRFFTSFIVEDAFCKLCTPSLNRTICCCCSEVVLSNCFLNCSSLLLVSHSFFDADIDDPPSSVMLACGLAAILSLFLRGCDVVLSTRCCLTFFLCGVFHLQQMPQFRNTRTMVSYVIDTNSTPVQVMCERYRL